MIKIRKFNELKYTGPFPCKYKIGDKVKIKDNLEHLIGKLAHDLTTGKYCYINSRVHPLYGINGCDENAEMNEYLGREAQITYIVYEDNPRLLYNHKGYYRYQLDIDDGHCWWIDECFV